MQFNRNHYVLIGMILLLLGVQFRCVESFLLNEPSSRFINQKLEGKKEGSAQPFAALMTVPVPAERRTIRLPRWLGWSLISIGSVLVLHSLVMKKPG